MTGHATACQAPWAALVVDDDAGVRQSLPLWLETAGARVLGVATGRGALEALDRESTNARRDGQFAVLRFVSNDPVSWRARGRVTTLPASRNRFWRAPGAIEGPLETV